MRSIVKASVKEKNVGKEVMSHHLSKGISYKIYITASPEAATLIAKGLHGVDLSRIGGEVLKIESGCVYGDRRIPEACYSREKYFALMEYYKGTDDNYPEYSIMFC